MDAVGSPAANVTAHSSEFFKFLQHLWRRLAVFRLLAVWSGARTWPPGCRNHEHDCASFRVRTGSALEQALRDVCYIRSFWLPIMTNMRPILVRMFKG
jgi:hypothetical protein